MVEGGPKSSAVYFNPVQVDMQWIRRVNKEERMLMDKMQEGSKGGQQQPQKSNKIDDVYQHFGSAYFYQSEYLKNHKYNNESASMAGSATQEKFRPCNNTSCFRKLMNLLKIQYNPNQFFVILQMWDPKREANRLMEVNMK